jgi:hypothetical protein
MHEEHTHGSLRYDGRPAPNEVDRDIAPNLGDILARDQLDGLLRDQSTDKAGRSGQIRPWCSQAVGKPRQ